MRGRSLQMQGGAHSLRWHASLGARKETGTVRLPAAPRKRGSAGAKMYFYTLTTRMVRLGAPGSPSPVCLLTLNHFLSLCFFLNSLCLCTVNSLSPPPLALPRPGHSNPVASCQLADLTLKILHAPTPANGNAGLVSGEGSGRHLFTQQQRRKKTGPACHTTGTESGTTAHEMNLLHI